MQTLWLLCYSRIALPLSLQRSRGIAWGNVVMVTCT